MKVIYVIIFILLFSLVIFGILTRPKKRRLVIDPGLGKYNKNCTSEKISCHTDQDCANACTEASEGEEMVCQAIPETKGLTKEQRQILGANGPGCNDEQYAKEHPNECRKTGYQMGSNKYCIPAKAIASLKNCNVAHGGIPVFSGWSGGVNHMEFDCMCAYPLWASSRKCDPEHGGCGVSKDNEPGLCLLNPGICDGGTFRWDLTKKVESPIAGLCECSEGDILVVDHSGLPRCVPKQSVSYYDDLDVSTGKRGGQELTNVASLPLKPLNKTIDCRSLCPDGNADNCTDSDCELVDGACVTKVNQYTACSGGCCTSPNATCCGEDFCCPEGYDCDLDRQICIRHKCCPDEQGNCNGNTCCANETECKDGCCPFEGGVCCGDGATCCPQNYPMCDLKNNACNPKLIPLCTKSEPGLCQGLSETCPDGSNSTQCANGCCPTADATCCGEFCCPPEYPICDLEKGMCKMTN